MLIDDSEIKKMNDKERKRKLGKNEGRQERREEIGELMKECDV